MILARRIPNIRSTLRKNPQPGFGAIPAKFILPHFDRMKVAWSAYLFAVRRQLREEEFVLGIDENTALVGKIGERWLVIGAGRVHLLLRDKEQSFSSGSEFALPATHSNG